MVNVVLKLNLLSTWTPIIAFHSCYFEFLMHLYLYAHLHQNLSANDVYMYFLSICGIALNRWNRTTHFYNYSKCLFYFSRLNMVYSYSRSWQYHNPPKWKTNCICQCSIVTRHVMSLWILPIGFLAMIFHIWVLFFRDVR